MCAKRRSENFEFYIFISLGWISRNNLSLRSRIFKTLDLLFLCRGGVVLEAQTLLKLHNLTSVEPNQSAPKARSSHPHSACLPARSRPLIGSARSIPTLALQPVVPSDKPDTVQQAPQATLIVSSLTASPQAVQFSQFAACVAHDELQPHFAQPAE